MVRAIDFFTPTQRDQIREAIVLAEKSTSGEIRVHVENHVKINPLARAAFVFEELQMERTSNANGVLIYLAVLDQKFAIIGDVGIHQKVGEDFWNETRDILHGYFLKEDFFGGVMRSIEDCGQRLKKYFPIKPEDENELENEVSDDISLNEN